MLIGGAAAYASGQGVGIWEISVTSPQFCDEPKTALKKILHLFIYLFVFCNFKFHSIEVKQ